LKRAGTKGKKLGRPRISPFKDQAIRRRGRAWLPQDQGAASRRSIRDSADQVTGEKLPERYVGWHILAGITSSP
jgi:hypothetical protein